MKTDPLQQHNYLDKEGMPAGGVHVSPGCTIVWQNGPLGRHASDCDIHNFPGEHPIPCNCDMRKEPNGAFVETVIQAAADRIRWYQNVCDGRFRCEENAHALGALLHAIEALESRVNRREKAGTEGTHAKD